jgi:hypothetical protein
VGHTFQSALEIKCIFFAHQKYDALGIKANGGVEVMLHTLIPALELMD